ncbi:hypothetical protein PQX77_014813 [Marasmius sp. AFHP31]|nr:hypothetical protein PQX77_014813 [Marasmius sp. AFHP31]
MLTVTQHLTQHPRLDQKLYLNHLGPSPSPIYRLPREILTIIFKFTASLNRTNDTFLLKSGAGENSKPIKYDPQNQIAISQVCQQWREIALDLPNLWNTLQFETYSDIQRGTEFCKRLEGKKNTMLDILILTVSKKEYEDAKEEKKYLLWTEEMHEIFLMLAPYTSRFRSFHLQVHDGHCKAVARHYIGTKDGKIFGPAPNLETWQLYHFETFGGGVRDLVEATRRQPVTCFADDIPKLKNLSLIGVNLPWSSPYLKDLHSLELSLHTNDIRPGYEHWRNMLSRSPELRTLFLHYSGPQLSAEWPVEVITLAKLETLGLVDLEPEYLQAITSRLDTPNIKKLEIELRDEEDETVAYDDWLCSISTNGSHKFQSLVSLTITELQCGDFDTSLRMFLGTLNHLRELEMKDEVWSSVWRMFVNDLEWMESTTEGGVTQVAAPTSSPSSSSPPLLLPKLEVVKVRDAMLADRTADVKLIVRSRKRSRAGGKQQSPGPWVVDEDGLFAIVGTLPVHVKPPKGTTSDSSERNRQTQILRRLVRLIKEGQREEEEYMVGEENYGEEEEHSIEGEDVRGEDDHGEEDETSWKVCVDITIEAIREEVYEDDGEPVEYSDGEEEEEEEEEE